MFFKTTLSSLLWSMPVILFFWTPPYFTNLPRLIETLLKQVHSTVLSQCCNYLHRFSWKIHLQATAEGAWSHVLQHLHSCTMCARGCFSKIIAMLISSQPELDLLSCEKCSSRSIISISPGKPSDRTKCIIRSSKGRWYLELGNNFRSI